MPSELKLPVYILAGGKSARFGSDKARVEIEGEALLPRLARLVAPIASSVTAVAKSDGAYADLGVRTIADAYQDAGPLAGLHAALADAARSSPPNESPSWVLLLSCDLVVFDTAWYEALARHRVASSRAVAFRHEKWEPLIGLYRTTLLHEVQRHLDARRYSLQRLLDDVGAQAVELPKRWPSVWQVNTPDDLRRYRSD